MYLMLKDKPIMQYDFTKQEYKVFHPELMPFPIRDKIKNVSNDEIVPGISIDKINEIKDAQQSNYNAVLHFLASRILNLDRENAKKILNAYHFSQAQDDQTKAQIAVTCKAISMTDDYWIKDENTKLQWEDMNLRRVPLNTIVTHIALKGSSFTIQGQPHTPELTGMGAYAKAWIRENAETYLLKKSTKGGMESEIEVSVSNILDCFNVPHIVYEKANFEGSYVCKCKNMVTDELSIAPAEHVYSYLARTGQEDIIAYTKKMDPENLYKMIIIDYLISNADRHMLNWGFYMNNKTGENICLHPLFDHNNGFDEETMKDPSGGDSLLFSNKSKKEAALYAAKHCNLRCIAPITRDMFLTDEMYESFMSRAKELHLCIENKPTLLQKMGLKHFEKYSMIISEDDHAIEQYWAHIKEVLTDNDATEHKKEKILPAFYQEQINEIKEESSKQNTENIKQQYSTEKSSMNTDVTMIHGETIVDKYFCEDDALEEPEDLDEDFDIGD